MKVRIRLLPLGSDWVVETKKFWFLSWKEVTQFGGDDAQKRALAYANRLKHPTIIKIN